MQTDSLTFLTGRARTNRSFARIAFFLILQSCLVLAYDPRIAAQSRVLAYSLEVRTKDNFPHAIHFFCLEGYAESNCRAHVLVLRNELARYSIANLAPWSFILVPRGLWDEMVRAAGGPQGTPAFTALHSRETFLHEALFLHDSPEQMQLMRTFRTDQRALFELAIAHELGHALCQETNEQRAIARAEDLRLGRPLHCR